MSSYDPNNIFAKILRGEVPSHKVYEDEHSLAFLDIMPRTQGHTLVIPKAPARNLLDVPREALAHTIVTVQTVAQAAKVAFKADGTVTILGIGRRPGRVPPAFPHPAPLCGRGAAPTGHQYGGQRHARGECREAAFGSRELECVSSVERPPLSTWPPRLRPFVAAPSCARREVAPR